MAKTKNHPNWLQSGGLAALRSRVVAPKSRTLSDYLYYLPPGGVIDLSQHPDHQPLSTDLLPFVAPLTAVSESHEEYQAHRDRLIAELPITLADNLQFLPERFQNPAKDSAAITNAPSIQVIDRSQAESEKDRSSPERQPLEVVVRERYIPVDSDLHRDRGFGIGHYVYDPLTERWLIVQRWGRGENKKRSGQITPFFQLAASRRRFQQVAEELAATKVVRSEGAGRQLASESQIKDSLQRWRARR